MIQHRCRRAASDFEIIANEARHHRNGRDDERLTTLVTNRRGQTADGGLGCIHQNEWNAMLRHACGYALANKGRDTRALQAYLGHRNFQHTVRYTELSPSRFRDFWRS